MNRIKTAAVSTKNHIKTHKFAYAATAVAIAAIALQQKNLRDFYKFLEENGIDPIDFYMPDHAEWEAILTK